MLVQYSEAVIWRCSLKENVLKIFSKFTGKQLWQSLFFNTVAGLSPLHFGEKKVCERKETVL